MKRALWGDGSGLDEAMAAYTAGDDRRWDQRLLRWDIIGTAGHIGGLVKAGLLTPDEHTALSTELDRAMKDADAGLFVVTEDDEDAHSALEHRLVTRLGELGEKVHTGRSRNDQVMAALRLYLKSALLEVEVAVVSAVRSLLAFGDRHHRVVMPGFTHIRRAMPSSVGLWAAGYAEILLDDLGLIDAVYDLADRGPLGSAAGYGVPLPLDRRAVSDNLGFASPQLAATAVQLSRGKLEAAVLSALWAVARDLAALAWDVILFSADEYGYFILPPELATGSSIMPQKRNPDVFELTRGRAGVIAGLATQAMAVAGSLPGGYHRDMQLTKGPMMEGIDTVHAMLIMMADAVPRLGIDTERCAAAVDGDLLATDEVYRRVRQGVPFRAAYRKVAAEVKEGGTIPPLDADTILAARRHLGGAGAPALDALEGIASRVSERIDSRHRILDDVVSRLLKTMNSVEDRRRVILDTIADRRIETQEQLVAALAEVGIEASQASISRDIAALRLVKSDGRWTAPPRVLPRANPFEERIAGRLLSVTAAGDHLLVLRTPAGEAQGVALALDTLMPDGVVGTVAGDDTIFVAVVDAIAGDEVAAWLRSLIPIEG